jgi:outer membrane protein insertion porin family
MAHWLKRCRLASQVLPLALLLLPAFTLSVHAQAQKVVAIEVKGNSAISTDAVLAALRTAIGADFSQQQVDDDRKSLERLGFFHEVTTYVEPAPGGVKVVFGVVEHPKVTRIDITGTTKVPEAKLREVMMTQVGAVFSEATLEKDIATIHKLYRENGYALARVTEECGISPEGTLKIPIAEGWIEAIKVTGNKKTKTRIILREMETKPGDVFDARQLQKDLMRLRNLDYFEMLDFQPADASEPGKVVLGVNVKEKKTGTVSVGLGYSSRERLVGFADITEHNFRGVGQQIGVRWEAGQFTNRSGYEFSFTDPWMLGKRTSLGFQLYNRTTNRPLLSNVVVNSATQELNTWVYERRKGVGISVGKPVGEFTRLLLDLRSDDVLYSTVPGYLDADQEAALSNQVLKLSDGRVTSATLRGVRDTRDLATNPHRGAFYSVSTELAGGPLGGSWSFGKVGVDLRRYFPIGRAKADGSNQMVLATRLMAGSSLGKMPLSENYWIGGAESLRGYREDEFNGSRTILFSTEFRVPFGTSLQGVTFFDYGYAWPRNQGLRLGEMKPAVGLGLRVITPLGPLRLDYGFGKDGGRSHFSIGHVF